MGHLIAKGYVDKDQLRVTLAPAARKEAVRELHKQGLPQRAIAKKIGVSPAAVQRDLASIDAAVSPIAKKTAAKYFDAQEAKLGPIEPVQKISKKLETTLRSKKASLTVWSRELQGSGIPAVVEALASTIEVIERHLP